MAERVDVVKRIPTRESCDLWRAFQSDSEEQDQTIDDWRNINPKQIRRQTRKTNNVEAALLHWFS